MNYANLVRRPFEIVARRPYLWLLGILAGGAGTFHFGGGNSNFGRGNGNFGPGRRGDYRGPDWAAIQAFWNQNWEWIVAAAAVLAVLAVVLFVVSCIAAGGLVRAAVEHDDGRDYGLRAAWRAGYSTGWRVAGLRLLTFLLAVAPAALIGAMVAGAVAGASSSSIGTAAVFGATAAVVAIASLVFWLLLSVAYQLALRVVVLENGRVAQSLSTGFRMIGWHFGKLALAWLILLALSFAAGIVAAIVAFVLAVPAAAVAVAGWFVGGGVGAIVSGSVAVVFFLGVLIPAWGAYSAYSSVFWTLLFRGVRDLPAPATGSPAPVAG